MDLRSQLLCLVDQNQKKIALFCGGCLLSYLTYKFVFRAPKNRKPELTVEQIRKIIEDLPFEMRNSEANLTLQDLLDELKDLNDDEEWKRLITSVQNFYNEDSRDSANAAN